MRASSVMTIVLMIGLVFTIFGLVITDMEQSYNQTSVDNSSFDFYDEAYTQEVNKSAVSLQKGLEEMTDEDNWFTNVGQGIFAILNAVVQVAKITFASMKNLLIMLPQIATEVFNIPTEIMIFGTVAIILMIVFSLINWWHSKTLA